MPALPSAPARGRRRRWPPARRERRSAPRRPRRWRRSRLSSDTCRRCGRRNRSSRAHRAGAGRPSGTRRRPARTRRAESSSRSRPCPHSLRTAAPAASGSLTILPIASPTSPGAHSVHRPSASADRRLGREIELDDLDRKPLLGPGRNAADRPGRGVEVEHRAIALGRGIELDDARDAEARRGRPTRCRAASRCRNRGERVLRSAGLGGELSR